MYYKTAWQHVNIDVFNHHNNRIGREKRLQAETRFSGGSESHQQLLETTSWNRLQPTSYDKQLCVRHAVASLIYSATRYLFKEGTSHGVSQEYASSGRGRYHKPKESGKGESGKTGEQAGRHPHNQIQKLCWLLILLLLPFTSSGLVADE